jgi:hypothetical protein
MLLENPLITNLDNIIYPLGSAALAKVLTQPMYQNRLLGVTKTITLPTNVMWTATGNNIAFRGDLTSRSLLCRIDAAVEHPEEREFKIADLPDYLRQQRPELVTCALTILRAYHVAGRPAQDIKPWGGFDEWSREIRAPIVWLGLADPCLSRTRITENDPEREANAEVLRQWFEVFGSEQKFTRDVVDAACQEIEVGKTDEDKEKVPLYPALGRALLAVARSKDNAKAIDENKLGYWCRKVQGRIISGLRLCRVEASGHHARGWQVTK